jgi:hypothetical protein
MALPCIEVNRISRNRIRFERVITNKSCQILEGAMKRSILTKIAFAFGAVMFASTAASAQAPARGEFGADNPQPAPPALQRAPAEKIAPPGDEIQPQRPSLSRSQEPAIKPNATDGQAAGSETVDPPIESREK